MEQNARELYSKGINFYNGSNGFPLNRHKALEYLQEAALLGDSDAMNHLGVIYQKGEFVTQSYTQAIEWFVKAVKANPNNPYATYNLGHLYYNGLGVVKNTAKALEYLKISVTLGKGNTTSIYPSACLISGEILLLTYKKPSEAYYYYIEAAKYGKFAIAWHNLGYITEMGIVPKNSPAAHSKAKRDSLATNYYKNAANLGYADSMVSLARIYMKYGMRDEVENWLENAICAGHPKAKMILKSYKFGQSGSVFDLFG